MLSRARAPLDASRLVKKKKNDTAALYTHRTPPHQVIYLSRGFTFSGRVYLLIRTYNTCTYLPAHDLVSYEREGEGDRGKKVASAVRREN